jgi:ribonuclease HII
MFNEALFTNTSIGVDEAGRGALAGPVVAAAVLLDPALIPSGIADSKTLTSHQRETAAVEIKRLALAWAIAFVDNTTIDTVNILQATYQAMHHAIDEVYELLDAGQQRQAELLIDGNRFRPHALPWRCIVRGDAKNLAIGAASILAKVERDRWMVEVADVLYPTFGFVRHKGYGTVIHRQQIKKRGACPLHRKTFLTKIFADTTMGSDRT